MTFTEALAEIDRLRAEVAELKAECSDLSAALLSNMPRGPGQLGKTYMQCAVAACLLDGMGYRDIAASIGRSVTSVKETARRIRTHLGQPTTADAMVILRAAARMQ